MSDESTPKRVTVKTALGGDVDLICPVCSHKEFISIRAKSIKPGMGFQHLVLGQEVRDGQLGAFVALPVRFHACANCGHILKFLMARP